MNKKMKLSHLFNFLPFKVSFLCPNKNAASLISDANRTQATTVEGVKMKQTATGESKEHCSAKKRC